MKKILILLIVILMVCIATNNLWSVEVPVAIKGQILAVEPSKSITVEIKKSKGIEIGLTEIKTLAVLDQKELTDGVGTAAIVGGISGGVGSRMGVVNPPESLRRSKLRDAGLVGVATAALSVLGRIGYNFLTQKSPMLVYDVESVYMNNVAVISQLPIGTRVRITQKNHINGSH